MELEPRLHYFSKMYREGNFKLELPGLFGAKYRKTLERNKPLLKKYGITGIEPFIKVLLQKDMLLPIFESSELLGNKQASHYLDIMDSIPPGNQFFCDGPKEDVGFAVETSRALDLRGPEPVETHYLTTTPQTYYPWAKHKGDKEWFSILIPYPDTEIEILLPYFACMAGRLPTKESVLKRRDEFEMHDQTSKLVEELSDIVEYDIVKEDVSEILSNHGF